MVLRRPVITFQFSPLREGRPVTLGESLDVTSFQFSPLREGRPENAGLMGVPVPISILAPARGATYDLEIDTATSEFQFSPLREGRHAFVR